MKFWYTGFWLATRKRANNWKILWWNSETLAFVWLRRIVRKIFKKYFDEISRHSVLIGCEESCGKLKNTLMKSWDTHFWLIAKKCAEKLKKYFDEILRHWRLIGCEETWGKFRKILWWNFETLAFDWLRGTWGNVWKNTLMKYRDTRFWLAARKRAENSEIP